MSNPIDHHYLAIFYLNRWTGEDGKVCRFSRPHGDTVVSKRTSPKGTAYEEHLYSMRTPDGPPIADMERKFMSRLDSEAAEALDLLEKGLPETKWERRLRSAWSRFIWAQSIRTPSEIAQLKSSVKEAWSAETPGLQEAYEAERPEGAPESVDEWLAALDSFSEDHFALTIARRSMDHPAIGQIINNMRWKVLDFDGCDIPLLTSDRPVRMTTTLAETDAFIMMPIGPNRLFVATRETQTMRRIAAQKRREQAKHLNKITVQHAVKYVFGVDEKMIGFVRKHFAVRRHATQMERLAAMHGHTIVSDNNPTE